MQIEGKNVTVVGLARSGIGAANCLSGMGAVVTVTDINTEDLLADSARRLVPGVRRALGGHPDHLFLSADMIVMSPGVPLDIPPVASAKAKGIPVIGELELAYQILDSLREDHPVPFLAITGSNGKSTTTTLLDYMLRKNNRKTLLGGNIGNALTDEIRSMLNGSHAAGTVHDIEYVVAEVSSFQLESIDTFRPSVAAILNITPDHLDRYHSMGEYREAKARMFLNQKAGDYLVLNADDPETARLKTEVLGRKQEKPNIVFFSRTNQVDGIYCKNGMVYCNMPGPSAGGPHFPLIAADRIRIKGVHNLENAMAAAAMALLANCPAEAVINALEEFAGLEHRLEFVRELDGVRYINDSKGTNVGAVVKSIESFTEPLVLIAGGRDKAGDFSVLRDLVKRKIKAIVLIGEAGRKIRDALGDLVHTEMAKDLREAVFLSRGLAEQGDVVLLSPACASFDMFKDFEDRGRQFKNLVMELRGSNE